MTASCIKRSQVFSVCFYPNDMFGVQRVFRVQSRVQGLEVFRNDFNPESVERELHSDSAARLRQRLSSHTHTHLLTHSFTQTDTGM